MFHKHELKWIGRKRLMRRGQSTTPTSPCGNGRDAKHILLAAARVTNVLDRYAELGTYPLTLQLDCFRSGCRDPMVATPTHFGCIQGRSACLWTGCRHCGTVACCDVCTRWRGVIGLVVMGCGELRSGASFYTSSTPHDSCNWGYHQWNGRDVESRPLRPGDDGERLERCTE